MSAKNQQFAIQKSKILSLPLPPEFFGIKFEQSWQEYVRLQVKYQWVEIKFLTPTLRPSVGFCPTCRKSVITWPKKINGLLLKLSTEAIRTINKNGLYTVVKELRAEGSIFRLIMI